MKSKENHRRRRAAAAARPTPRRARMFWVFETLDFFKAGEIVSKYCVGVHYGIGFIG